MANKRTVPPKKGLRSPGKAERKKSAPRRGSSRLSKKRIFISFAMEDIRTRDLLVGQGRNSMTPFSFIDLSVKRAWDSKWKTQCRTRIKGCSGLIALISRHTRQADGQLWEIKCAKEEGVPIRAIYISQTSRPKTLPKELSGTRVVNWTWENIDNFLNRL